MSLLRFENVACERGGRLLFEDVSFVLGPGEAGLVTGPNGTGKSSLLRVAAGLLGASAGAVLREGGVALADENLALDRELPLENALGFWARLDGGADRLAVALDAFGIAHLSPVPVRMLSTGQRKRAVLARVAASGAAIWLLDEPTNGLDAEAVGRLEQACEAHRAGGGAVLAATHQPFGLKNVKQIPFASSEVEKRVEERISTSLDTNGLGAETC